MRGCLEFVANSDGWGMVIGGVFRPGQYKISSPIQQPKQAQFSQQLMRELGLTHCVFTLDALHCQKETLETAHKTGNDVIVQVKGNQKTLLDDCQRIVAANLPDETYQEPVTKRGNRIESRKTELFFYPLFIDLKKWDLVKVVIKVTRYCQILNTKSKAWQETNEISYYISTNALSAQLFCQAIRNHWGIENKNHYVRDVTLGEDKSRIRTNPYIFANLRSFALNILRKNKVKNVSQELFNNCMNLENVLNYVGGL